MEAEVFLAKAEESLASAEDDYGKGRYNSCARNLYYAVFQAAVAALWKEEIRPRARWTHEFVRSEFAGRLIYRRKLYPAGYRLLLYDALRLRGKGDYTSQAVGEREVRPVLQRVRELVRLVKERIYGHR